jgi:outer membrane protein TolC
MTLLLFLAAVTPLDVLDGQIQTYLRRALQRNPALQVARANLTLSELELQQAKLQLLPQLAITFMSLDGSRETGAAPAVSGTAFAASANVGLLEGGRSWRALTVAEEGKVRAALSFYETEEDLIVEVLGAYYGYLSAREQLSQAKQSHKEVLAEERLVRRQFEHGRAFKTDVLGMTNQAFATQSSVLDAQEGVRLALNTLNRIMDQPHGTPIQIQDGFERPEFQFDEALYRNWARDHHPSVRRALLDLAAARRASTELWVSYLPSLTATASLSADRGTAPPAPLLSTGPLGWNVGLQMQLALPTWDAYYGAVGVRTALQQAESAVLEAQNLVDESVSEASIGLVARQRAVELAHLELEYARENYRSHKLGYKEGLHSFDVVNRIYSELRSAEVNLYATIRDLNIAWATLLRSMSIAHNLVRGDLPRGPSAPALAAP